MAKPNRATRKQLETIIKEIIDELKFLRNGFTAIDNYLGAYVKFKGDTLTFNDFLKTEVEKMEKKAETKTETPQTKDVKSDKKTRYNKIITPPL